MIRKPEPHEHAPCYVPRIALTQPDAMATLRASGAATPALFASCDGVALERVGHASGHPLSVRAAAHIIAGHELHHVALLRERYGLA